MDSLRGSFGQSAAFGEDADGYDLLDNDIAREAPPPSIGQDERRMQVRAYNHWASLLGDNQFPSIEDLDPENLPDFGPHSVLLDFTSGIENPGISYLGAALAEECGTNDEIRQLSDIPGRSLLSRITDHYMQILANQAPVGFEAEFVNDRGKTIAYRGILLPFSSDDDTIDFIYGVINWKELADQLTTDQLMLEIGQALGEQDADEGGDTLLTEEMPDAPLFTTLASASLNGLSGARCDDDGQIEDEDEDILDLGALIRVGQRYDSHDLPEAAFGLFEDFVEPVDSHDTDPAPDVAEDLNAFAEEVTSEFEEAAGPSPFVVAIAEPDHAPLQPELAPAAIGEAEPETRELGDWLASARELAWAAHASEDRSRHALYEAIGRAYDFALASADAPEDFAELIADAGVKLQERAPMTPVVKLVFGVNYDKTRLTEFAAALSHGIRLGIAQGDLAGFLTRAEGGLKAVVAAERRLRREESGKDAGKDAQAKPAAAEKLARKLRQMQPLALDAIEAEGDEFALVMIRRMPDGAVTLLGEVAGDTALVERAARKLIG